MSIVVKIRLEFSLFYFFFIRTEIFAKAENRRRQE